MGLEDIVDSIPSVAGFGLTSAACFAVPAAIPLAALQFSVISDPAQMWHAGRRHTHLAGRADSAKAAVYEAVKTHASEGRWSADDKRAFLQSNVEPYISALEQTRDSHNGANATLTSLARGYMGAGLLSLTIGGFMAFHAAVVAGLSWVPGVNLVAEGEATAAATASSGILRTALKAILVFIRKAATILMGLKGLLGLGMLGYGTVNLGKGMLGMHGGPAMWPGIDPRTGQE